VVISHSRTLAEGVVELVRGLGIGGVPVEPAGGDVGGGLGTSIERVERAVRAVDTGAGVVLLADLGSAVLTAKAYLQEHEEHEEHEEHGEHGERGEHEAAGRAVLADAPLVEGAVAAASAAATGADLAAVLRAAARAYDIRKA
jgi:dihydroxyacetone kinase DhaKLM complex PTS-EIIA-like component DhaM